MRVLHIAKFFPPDMGGMETYARSVVEALRPTVSDQRVLCYGRPSVDYSPDQTIFRVPCWATVASQPLGRILNALSTALTELDPDIIHLHLPNPLASVGVTRLSPRRRLVVHWHSDIVGKRIVYGVYKHIENRVLNRADVIVATSPDYAKSSLRLRQFGEKVVICPICVSPDKLRVTDEAMQAADLLRATYPGNRVLFVGRHVPYKGLHHLEHIARSIEDAHLLVAGTGPLRESVVDAAAKNCPNLHVLGELSDAELVGAFMAADVLAFPSHLRSEAYGITMLEAHWFGVPVVSFQIPGSGVNYVNQDHKTGLVVPNDDGPSFCAAVSRLLEDKNLRTALGSYAMARARSEFAEERFRERMHRIHKGVADTEPISSVQGSEGTK